MFSFNLSRFKKVICSVIFSAIATFSLPIMAEPTLKSSIKISSSIVTVGDMFTNAGLNAELALFRAPKPGTTGSVSLESIRIATLKIGVKNFETNGLSFVSVERTGVLIDEKKLKKLIISDLKLRGLLSDGSFAEPKFNSEILPFFTVISDKSIVLNELRYTPTNDGFYANFQVLGRKLPLELRGKLNLMIKTPHLKTSLASGSIISANDIEMRDISVNFARNAGFANLEQIVGKQLKRPTRAGMMVRPSDLMEPELIKRSAIVTIYYKRGPLTLTASGQALNSAAKGEMVSVLNIKSKQIIQAIATKINAVEIIIPGA